MLEVTVVAHRGVWRRTEEQNTIAAIERARDMGFGVEIDVRDSDGDLVVSHDPPTPRKIDDTRPASWLLSHVFKAWGDCPSPVAVNVKSSGLASLFKSLPIKPKNWYAFDISYPDLWSYLRAGIPYYVRMGPGERAPDGVILDSAAGVWLDGDGGAWVPKFMPWKPVCVVSPELHDEKFSHTALWGRLKSVRVPFSVCTDRPAECRTFFQ